MKWAMMWTTTALKSLRECSPRPWKALHAADETAQTKRASRGLIVGPGRSDPLKSDALAILGQGLKANWRASC